MPSAVPGRRATPKGPPAAVLGDVPGKGYVAERRIKVSPLFPPLIQLSGFFTLSQGGWLRLEFVDFSMILVCACRTIGQ
jgi:hypothetical protein